MAALGAKYIFRAWTALKSRSVVPDARRFYNGGFQQLMDKQEATLIPGARVHRDGITAGPRGGNRILEEEETPAKIHLVIKYFKNPFIAKLLGELLPNTSKTGLCSSRALYTVLRSPHIDKKSREQFETQISKQLVVIKTKRHELRKKLFWLKRLRTFGAQCEMVFSYKNRMPARPRTRSEGNGSK